MKRFIIFSISIIGYALYAQQPYYNDVDLSLSGIALKEALATKITNTHTHTLDYSDVREAIKIVDLVPGQGTNVYLVYGFTNDLCPSSPSNDDEHKRRNKSDFGGGGTCEWNREHTYPKSLGTPNLGTSGPGADAHMLRACDTQRNSQRGSKPFRDATGNSHIVNTNYWYPGDEWKGDIARMMMYMYLRYGDRCLPINVGFGNNVTNDVNMLELFLDWNAEDPVSELEVNRNSYLSNQSNTYGQGNRNPFIDNPYLATRIWGGQTAEDIWGIYLSIEESKLSNQIIIYPNPATDRLFLNLSETIHINTIKIFTSSGHLVNSLESIPLEGISLQNLSKGIYYIKISTKQGVVVKQLIIK